MDNTPKSNLILRILTIATPLLMVFTVVILVYAWYTNTLQTGEIDATTKNFTIEYTFDDDTEKNVLEYEVDDIAFFQYQAEEEIDFLEGEVVPLEINLLNKSTSDMIYTITLKSTKTVLTGTKIVEEQQVTVVQSVAYIGAVLDFDDIGSTDTYKSIQSRVEVADDENYTAAEYDISATDAQTSENATQYFICETTGEIATGVTTPTTITLYLFGIQEIEDATNDMFIYNSNGTLKSYSFELTINAVPISNATEEENS